MGDWDNYLQKGYQTASYDPDKWFRCISEDEVIIVNIFVETDDGLICK